MKNILEKCFNILPHKIIVTREEKKYRSMIQFSLMNIEKNTYENTTKKGGEQIVHDAHTENLSKKNHDELLEEKKRVLEERQDIQEERKVLEENIQNFVEKMSQIVESNPEDIETQYIQMKEMEEYNSLPDEIKNRIDDNRDKFNFIDYKYAEDFLKEDPNKKQIKALTQKQHLIEKLIAKKMSEQQNTPDEKNEYANKVMEKLNDVLSEMYSKSRVMLDALYERQNQHLSPLQTTDNFTMIAGLLKNISNREKLTDPQKIPEVVKQINTLGRLFEEINPKRGGRYFRENPKNLEKLMYGAKSFASFCEESLRRIPIEKNSELEDNLIGLKNAFYGLSEKSSRLYRLAGRLRETLH